MQSVGEGTGNSEESACPSGVCFFLCCTETGINLLKPHMRGFKKKKKSTLMIFNESLTLGEGLEKSIKGEVKKREEVKTENIA